MYCFKNFFNLSLNQIVSHPLPFSHKALVYTVLFVRSATKVSVLFLKYVLPMLTLYQFSLKMAAIPKRMIFFK